MPAFSSEEIPFPHIAFCRFKSDIADRSPDCSLAKWDASRVGYDDAKVLEKIMLHEKFLQCFGNCVGVIGQKDDRAIRIRFIGAGVYAPPLVGKREKRPWRFENFF